MKEYICIWITSDICGHCKISRKDGIMGSGGEMMKPSSIMDILESNKDLMFMNINYENMKGAINNINAISKFYKDDNNLVQNMWVKNRDKVKCIKLTAEKSVKKIKNVNNTLTTNWTSFIKTKIPTNLQDYVYYYPAFLIVKTSNWVDSIKTNSTIYGITDVGKTKISVDGKVSLDKNSLNSRIINYKQLLKDFNTGKETFVPKLDERTEEPEAEPEEPEAKPRFHLVPVRY